jgi:predicted lipoprotein with Yx(FWY)xxD motif
VTPNWLMKSYLARFVRGMIVTTLLAFLLALIPQPVDAQTTPTVSNNNSPVLARKCTVIVEETGNTTETCSGSVAVKDSQTGQPLSGAVITIVTKENDNTLTQYVFVTNNYGVVQYNIKGKPLYWTISKPGYYSQGGNDLPSPIVFMVTNGFSPGSW